MEGASAVPLLGLHDKPGSPRLDGLGGAEVDQSLASAAGETSNLQPEERNAPTSDSSRPPSPDTSSHVTAESAADDTVVDLESAKQLLDKTIRLTQYIGRGSMLPLVQDKIRNNTRSMSMVAMLYVVACLLAFSVVALAFVRADQTTHEIDFVIDPPSSIVIGERWPSFVVRLSDADGLPVRGARIELAVVSAVGDAKVRIPSQNDQLRQIIPCSQEAFSPGSIGEFSAMCSSPPSPDALVQPTATTDALGVANFGDVRMLHALPTRYVVLARFVVPPVEQVRREARGLLPFVFAYRPVTMLQPTDLEVAYNPSQDPAFDVPPAVAVGQALNLSYTVSYSTLDVSVTSNVDVAAAVLAIDVTGQPSTVCCVALPFSTSLTVAPVPPSGSLRDPTRPLNGAVSRPGVPRVQVSVALTESNASVTVTKNAGKLVYTVNANVTCSVTLAGVSRSFLYPQLLLLGSTFALPHRQSVFSEVGMNAKQMSNPLQVTTDIEPGSVTAVFAAPMARDPDGVATIGEGLAFGLVLTLSRPESAPRRKTLCYLSLDWRSPAAATSEGRGNTFVDPKYFTRSIVHVDEGGRGSLVTAVSVNGVVGEYIVHGICDGVPIAAANADGLSLSLPMRLRVTTSVQRVHIVDTWDGSAVAVGEPLNTPAVTVFDAAGRPLVGKTMTVRPNSSDFLSDLAHMQLGYTAQLSDRHGRVKLSGLVVNAAILLSEVAPYRFHFVVEFDGVPFGGFARILQGYGSPSPTALEQCAAISMLYLPRVVYPGYNQWQNQTAIVRVVNKEMVSVLGQLVGILPLNPPERSTEGAGVAYSGENGLLYLPLRYAADRLSGLTAPTFREFSIACFSTNITLLAIERVSVVYRPRVAATTAVNSTAHDEFPGRPRVVTIQLHGIVWDVIDDKSPLQVGIRLLWFSTPAGAAGASPPAPFIVASIGSPKDLGPNATLSVDLRTLPRSFAYMPGSKVAAVTVDGAAVESTTAFFEDDVRIVGSVDLVDSAYRGIPLNRVNGFDVAWTDSAAVANFTRPFRRPVVAVRDSAGNLVTNQRELRIFAQAGTAPITDLWPTLESVEWQQATSFALRVGTAAVCDGEAAVVHGTYQDMAANGTDEHGEVALPPLFFAGADTSKWMFVRYCASVAVPGASLEANLSRTVCAAEPVAIKFSQTLQLELSVPTTFVSGTPTKVVTQVQVVAPNAPAELQPTLRILVSDVSSMASVGAASDVTSSNLVGVAGQFSVLPAAPESVSLFIFPSGYSGGDGQEFQFQLFTGGAMLPMTYRAVTTPSQLTVSWRIQDPLPLDSFILLATYVYAPGPLSNPIDGVPCAVTVEVANATEAKLCRPEFDECGVLSPSSTLVAETVATSTGGLANNLHVEFAATRQQAYRVTVHALKPDSAAGTLQLFSVASRAVLVGAYGTADRSVLQAQMSGSWIALALVELLSAPLSNSIADASVAVKRSVPLQPLVTNPVTTVRLIRETPLSLKALRIAEVSRIEDEPKIVLRRGDAPVVQLLNANGTALSGVPASVFVVDARTGAFADSVAVVARGNYVSDDRGFVNFEGVEILPSHSGSFRFYFNSRGSSGVYSTVDIIVELDNLDLAKSLKFAIAVVAAIFLPLSCVTVPFARAGFSVVGFACLCAFGGFYAHELHHHWHELGGQSLGVAYFATLSTLICALFVVATAVSLLTIESPMLRKLVANKPDTPAQRRSSWYRRVKTLLLLNGEGRAHDTFLYARWITTADIQRQMLQQARERREAAEGEATRSKSSTAKVVLGKIRAVPGTVAGWLDVGAADRQRMLRREALEEVVDAVRLCGCDDATRSIPSSPIYRHDNLEDEEMVALNDDVDDPAVGRGAVRGIEPVRPPLQRPDDVPSAVFVPLNVLIVLSLATALVIVLLIAAIYGFGIAVRFFDRLIACLPNPSASAAKDVSAISDTFVDLLADGAATDPSLGFLAPVVGALRGINVLQILKDVRHFLVLFRDSLEAALIIGTIAAAIVVVVTLVFTVRDIEPLVLRARRGELSSGPELTVPGYAFLEGYVTLHALTVGAVFGLALFGAAVVAIALLVEPIRVFLYHALFFVVLAAAVSTIVTMLVQTAVMRFLVESWLVVRPEWYALYSLLEFVLQAFKAPLLTITRWVEGLVFVSLCFGRLGEPLFPKPFSALDKGASAFRSTVLLEARYSNPIILTFASTMVLDRLLKRAAAARAAVVSPHGSAGNANTPRPADDEAAIGGTTTAGAARADTVVAMAGDHQATLCVPLVATDESSNAEARSASSAAVLRALAPELSLALLSNPEDAMDREKELLQQVADDPTYIASVDIDSFAAVSGLSGRVTALCRILLRWHQAVDTDLALKPFHGWRSVASQDLTAVVSPPDSASQDPVIRDEPSSSEEHEEGGPQILRAAFMQREACRLPYFDAAQYVRDRRRRKVLLRWTLLLLLARNPTLRLYRKRRLAQLRARFIDVEH